MQGDIYVIKIGEHEFETPPEPPRRDILFSNLPKTQQYWRRQTDFPKVFFDWHDEKHSSGEGVELDCASTLYHPDTGLLIQLSREDTSLLFDTKERDGKDGLRDRELRRRIDGVWFMNNGEPTYLTGDHYFALQWGAMLGCDNTIEPGSSYGQYYQFQRDTCYYFEICKKTPYGRGGVFIKPKKTGITQLMSLVCLNQGTINRQKQIRMMSITEDLCRDANFNQIAYAMQKMPNILMPSRSKQNLGEVIFGPPSSSRNPMKKTRRSDQDYLNTRICTVPTVKNAFDSFTNHIALIDEFPKIKNSTYPEELFLTTIVTVIEGFRRKGTIFALSYVPEQTDRSFYEARQIYKNSKLSTRQKDDNGEYIGETKSKLICHTLTVQEGMFNCCDQYGRPDLKKIWATIDGELRDVKDDPVKLQAVKRQYPTNENDPWGEASKEDSLFDNVRLGTQLIDMEEKYSLGLFPYEEFELSYTKEPVKKKLSEEYDFTGVEIKYQLITHDMVLEQGIERGKWKWYDKHYTPEWFLKKHLYKPIYDKKGRLTPNYESPFFISIDPTNYRSKKFTGVGSYNAIQAFILPDAELNSYIGENVTNKRLMIEYLYRQDKPSETLHDIIRLILYLGCMVQIESNMPTWAESLIEMGLGNFLLMMNKEGAIEPYRENREQVLFTSQAATIQTYVAAGAEHLGAPIKPGDIDNVAYIKSINVLSQLTRITIESTKEYDAAVAYLEGIMGINSWLGWKRAELERKGRYSGGTMKSIASYLIR